MCRAPIWHIDPRCPRSPHLGQEGPLIDILDVLKVGGGDLHLVWLDKSREQTWETAGLSRPRAYVHVRQ